MLVKIVKNKIASQTNSLSSSSVSGASSIQSTMRHGDTTTTNIGSSKSSNKNWRANNPLTQMQADSPGISEILMNSSLPALPNLVENPPMIINFTQYTSTNNIIWRNGPYIDSASSPNVTALLGKTAYLVCSVKNLGDKTVSKKLSLRCSSLAKNAFYFHSWRYVKSKKCSDLFFRQLLSDWQPAW